jgi:asparagine synthase (glutamine-hydrolysing)
MCGIAGFISANAIHAPSNAEREHLLDRMCKVIEHRGPDDQGTLVKGPAALGMRRLSIIDLAGGHQPLSGCDGRLTIVFNGEIYNYRELRQELESAGHLIRTDSDTEVIVHAFEEWGTRCLERLRGMFGFALWNSETQSLFIARDRVGKKPLFYSLTATETLVFGSELKSLLEHPEVERNLDDRAIDAYLTLGYVPDPLCIFRDVQKLPPGHFLVYERGSLRIERYWDFDYSAAPIERAEEGLVEELRSLIDEAVRIRLVSDVPLGAFLSGGVDSSSVVAFMARHMREPVKTFSIGFREDSFNELKYARIAAKHFGTDHHEFIVTPDICQLVEKLVSHFDEPFADSSALPTYMVSKLAREHVTVVLSGDGGDELFGGYTRYVIDQGRRGFGRLPRFVRHGVLGQVSKLLPHGAYGRNFLHNISLDDIARYADSVSIFNGLSRTALYDPGFKHRLDDVGGVLVSFEELARRVGRDDELDRLLYIDSKTYLPGDILTKVDRMSMAASLEARVPLLDHKLIEFVSKLPSTLKLSGFETKRIFKRAMRGIVPDEILDRGKQGFGVPMERWINSELKNEIQDVVTSARSLGRGYFNRNQIDLLFKEHHRGRRDHSMQLWTLFMLELWQRQFVDGDVTSAQPQENDATDMLVARS